MLTSSQAGGEIGLPGKQTNPKDFFASALAVKVSGNGAEKPVPKINGLFSFTDYLFGYFSFCRRKKLKTSFPARLSNRIIYRLDYFINALRALCEVERQKKDSSNRIRN